MEPGYSGRKFGCSDSEDPETYTDWALSRTHDILFNAWMIGGDKLKKAMWDALPKTLKMEYNYCKWSYQPQVGNKIEFVLLDVYRSC